MFESRAQISTANFSFIDQISHYMMNQKMLHCYKLRYEVLALFGFA